MHLKPIARKLTVARSIFIFLCISLISTAAMAAGVTLGWDSDDSAPDGYRVFVRQSGQDYDYSQPVWEGTAATCTLDNLADQTDYYFVVRAYNGSLESADSNEIHYHSDPSTNRISADEDNDGMPDDWEIIFGLDPAIEDADDDLDGDGIGNLDEYRAGLEPDDAGEGTAPQAPLPVTPIDYTEVATNPLLTAADFMDEEGDAHIATQWQIFDADTENCLLDVVSDRRLTSLRVPYLILNGGMTLSWRLRFFDSSGRVSDWSDIAYCTTRAAADDYDGTGIPDDQQSTGVSAAGVHALSSAEAAFEPTAISVVSEDTISAIDQMTVLDPADFATDETTPARLPSGMVAYRLVLFEPGQVARVTVQLSDAAPAGSTWVKYDAVNGWQDYTQHTVFSADRRAVTVDLKDGGYGDADGVVNGIIVDPSGLAQAAEDATDTGASVAGSSTDGAAGGGGGGGCFITASLGADQPMGMVHGLWHWLKTKARGLFAVISS